MSQVSVVKNSLTPLGIREVHLMRMGALVGTQDWKPFIPAEVPMRNVSRYAWHEADLDVHHLSISWCARDAMVFGGTDEMVWWFLDGMSVRLAADCAAAVFRQTFGRWPGFAMMQRLPSGATATVPVCDGDACFDLPLVAADWVPVRFVVVGDRRK
jgi:hypothetical protein